MASRTPAPDAHLHRPRTEAELRGTLVGICEVLWNRDAATGVHIFSIPPQPDDADIVLSDGIEELIALRAEVDRLRATAAALYDEARYARDILYRQGFRWAGDVTPYPDNPYRERAAK